MVEDVAEKYLRKLKKVMSVWPDFFFKLSMDPLVGNDCPISIFRGLGGHGLSFFDFGQ